jgi:hypothetical protein
VLIVPVCGNGSNERSSLISMNTDTKETRIHKPASPMFTKETKFIAAQILYMQDRHSHA